MAKTVSPHAPLHTKKKKQHTKLNHNAVFKKILNYMISDTYMFAPLESCPNPISITSSQGGGECSGSINTTKKVYLTCNCYMYAPFAANCSDRKISVERIRVQQEMVKRVVVGHNCRSSPPPGKKAVSWKEHRKIILEQ